MSTSTHWMPADFAPDAWPDDPQEVTSAAVNLLLDDKDDDGWHAWDALRSEGLLVVTLNGFVSTMEQPPEDHDMDGYDPGFPWFKATGEKKFVRVTISMEIAP